MSDDPRGRNEKRISTDRETIRGWATEHDAVPVRHTTGDTEQLRLVPESRIGEDHERLEWDRFHDEMEQNENVVFYHGEEADEPFEVTTHDDAVARSGIEGDQLRERLIEGETVRTEIQETTVVESVVIEEATIESELVGTEIVDQQLVDMELVERTCANCDLVEARDVDHSEWFDQDRYLASVPDHLDISGSQAGSGRMAEGEPTIESEDTATVDTEDAAVAETGVRSEDVERTDVEMEFPYHAELDVEETWAITREVTERFTVESRITETDVTEAETVEDHDIDIQGLQRSILEQGLLGVDHDPDEVMQEYEVETEFTEGDRIETYFERTQVIEDDVVDRMQVRADITSADLTQMEVVSEQNLTTELSEETAVTGEATTTEETEMTGEVTADTDDVPEGTAAEAGSRIVLDGDDIGKPVVDADGDKVGTVDHIEDDGTKMYVEAHSGITQRIMSALNWGDEDDHENVIFAGQIAAITDDEVRLKEHEELGEHRNVHEST